MSPVPQYQTSSCGSTRSGRLTFSPCNQEWVQTGLLLTVQKCKLHINPPALPYTRSLRSAHDVKVYFTPTSTGKQVVHSRAHIFILSDLFLVADRMEAMEKATKAQQVAREQPNRVGEGGPMPEMWLAYPPLAGKHLSVVEGQQSEHHAEQR